MKLLLTIAFGISTSLAFANYNDDNGNMKTEKDDSRTTMKTKEGSEDFVKSSKSSWRNAKSKTCEVFNSKMECIKKRAEYKAKDLQDEADDKSNDVERGNIED